MPPSGRLKALLKDAIQAARTHLSRIGEDVVEGEEVVLARSGKPLVRLVPYAQKSTPRKAGALSGKIWEAPDCWAPGDSDLEASIEAPLLRESPPDPLPIPRRLRMLRLLLDSHVVVWWLTSPERLSEETRAMISSPDNEILFSAASAWELGLKVARGKLRLPDAYADCLLGDGVTELPVSIAHAVRAMRLPAIHGDPFDRLLVAQALEDDLVLVTADQVVCAYPAPIQKA